MSDKEEKRSLAALIAGKPKKIDKSSIKDKLKKSSFSQPINRLAELKKVKNDLEIMKYSWPVEKALKKEKKVITIGSISIKSTSHSKKKGAQSLPKTAQNQPLTEESSKSQELSNTSTEVSRIENERPISDFTQWINNKTKSMAKIEKSTKDKKAEKKVKAKIEKKTPLAKSKKVKKASDKVKKEVAKSKKSKETKVLAKAKAAKKDKKTSKSKKDLKRKIASSIRIKDEIATETLAEIYIEQGYFKKAIETYKQLSLINPEKSSFFAPLIKDLKNKLK